MNWLRRLRYQPKVEDCIVLIVIIAAVPAAMMVCALLNAIYQAWRGGIGA